LQNEDVDLAIRSEGGSEQVAVMKSSMSSPKMTLGLVTMLHSELPITLTWRANCQGVRPGKIRKGATQAVVG
jgi:hypothetical protein